MVSQRKHRPFFVSHQDIFCSICAMHKIVVYTLRLLPEAKILPASFAVCKGANNNTHLFKAKYWGSETQPLLRLQKEKKSKQSPQLQKLPAKSMLHFCEQIKRKVSCDICILSEPRGISHPAGRATQHLA